MNLVMKHKVTNFKASPKDYYELNKDVDMVGEIAVVMTNW